MTIKPFLKRRHRYFRSFSLLLLVLAIAVLIWQFSKSPRYQLFGELAHRVPSSDKVVALTFDDGPTIGKTETVLDMLAKEKIKATFYLVGDAIAKNMPLAKMIVSQGHEIGNHSYSHKRMVLKSPKFVEDEIESTNSQIRAAGYLGDITFRPPYGKKLFSLPYYLSRQGITTVTWDVNPDDELSLSSNPDEIASYIVNRSKPGSIILLHVIFDSRKTALQAVPITIQSIKAQGFRFVTISELLATK